MTHADYTIEGPNRLFEANAALVRGLPNATFLRDVDATDIEELRANVAGQGEAKPTYTAILAKAVSVALREHPYANRMTVRWPFFYRLVQFHAVHASVAVERGIPGSEMISFVGTIENSDEKSLGDIGSELRCLASATLETSPRWRLFHQLISRLPVWLSTLLINMPSRLPRQWLKHRGSSFVISSPAKYGVDSVVTAWPWPLGFSFGLVKERAVVIDGRVVARTTMPLVMTFDRRIMAGAAAARFFARIVELLEHADEAFGAQPGDAPRVLDRLRIASNR